VGLTCSSGISIAQQPSQNSRCADSGMSSADGVKVSSFDMSARIGRNLAARQLPNPAG